MIRRKATAVILLWAATTGSCFADDLDIGEKFYNENNFEAAYNAFDKAVKADPKNAYTYNERGMALNQLKKYREALEDFARAITLKPDLELAYGEQAKAYYGLRQFPEAIASATTAIKLDAMRLFESTGDAYYVRANCYMEQNKLAEALADLKACEQYKDHAMDAASLELKIAQKQKNFDEQIKLWTRLISMNPKEIRYYGNRGSTYWNMGQLEKGLADMEYCSKEMHAAGHADEAKGLDDSIKIARDTLARKRSGGAAGF